MIQCTCCDGEFQEERESALPVTLPVGFTQYLCKFCSMLCCGGRQEMEALGLEVVAVVETMDDGDSPIN